MTAGPAPTRPASRAYSPWLVFATCLFVYSTTAYWWGYWSTDTSGPAWAGWGLAHGYGNDLTGVPGMPPNEWLMHVGHRLVMGRTAGVVLAAVPVNVLLWPLHLHPDIGAVLTAVVATAAAMTVVYLALRSMLEARLARAATLLLAFGTPMWTVSSTMLWTHTVDALALAVFVLGLQRRSTVLVALAIPALVLTRPHLAVAVAVATLWVGARERQVRLPAVAAVTGVGSTLVLLAWNAWMFGRATIAIPTYDGQATRAASSAQLSSFVTDAAGTFLSPSRGLFVYTPAAVLALWCALRGWHHGSVWAKGAFLGGLAYQLVQLRLNGFAGGDHFYGNRLAVELCVLATPLCAQTYAVLRVSRPWLTRAMRALAGLSVGLFTVGALLAGTEPVIDQPTHLWRDWVPWLAVRAARADHAIVTVVLAIVAALLVSGAVPMPRQWARRAADLRG